MTTSPVRKILTLGLLAVLAAACGGEDAPVTPTLPTQSYGELCDDHADCISDLCVDTQGISLCSMRCEPGWCPGDDPCVDLGGTAICDPLGTPAPPPATCGPATCTGCCDGDRCVTATSTTQCGSGGVACASCGQTEICTARCEPALGRAWRVVVLGARIATYCPDGTAWDALGGAPPDPFVVVTVGPNRSPQSAALADTTTPTWNFAFDTRIDTSQSISIEVFDQDDMFDDAIGTVFIGASSLVTYLRQRGFTGKGGSVEQLTVAFHPR